MCLLVIFLHPHSSCHAFFNRYKRRMQDWMIIEAAEVWLNVCYMLCRPRNAGKGGKCDAMKITNAFQCIHLQIAFRSKYRFEKHISCPGKMGCINILLILCHSVGCFLLFFQLLFINHFGSKSPSKEIAYRYFPFFLNRNMKPFSISSFSSCTCGPAVSPFK